MTVNSPEFIHEYANRMAPLSKRQMPVFSQVGKGLRGDNANISINGSGKTAKMVGNYFNQMTGETETLFEIPLMEFVPKITWRIMKGIREVDNVKWVATYTIYKCYIDIQGERDVLWQMQTPWSVCHPFGGSNDPADWIVESADDYFEGE